VYVYYYKMLKRSKQTEESKFVFPASKRKRTSSSFSDSGVSSMSSISNCPTISPNNGGLHENKWPSLVLLTKPDIIVDNGVNRKRFPDPVFDRSILIACYDNAKNMVKLRQYIKEGTVTSQSNFKHRIPTNVQQMEEQNCVYFITLDKVDIFDQDGSIIKNNNNTIMLSDVRDHKVASNVLPKGVSGYWVRIFGGKSKYVLRVSLYKKLNVFDNNSKSKYKTFLDCKKTKTDEELMKIGELNVEFVNSGIKSTIKTIKKKRNKTSSKNSVQIAFSKKNLQACHHTPLFCCKERYQQITTVLSECLESGDYALYNEMYEKFSSGLQDANRDEIEMKLFLVCERSQYYAVQGNFPQAKKHLQNVAENVVPKSPNKVFLLNRAYLCLANVHIIEGNYGTAEECLTFLQNDRKHGIPFEDLISFYFLYGVVLINFSKKLPKLSKYLLLEAHSWLMKSLKLFDSLLPSYFHKYCRVYIYLTKYYLMQNDLCENNDKKIQLIDEAKKQFSNVELYGLDRLSLRLKSLFLITKGEIYIADNKVIEGYTFITKGETIAKEYNFYEELQLSETLKEKQTEDEYNNFINSINVSEILISEDQKKVVNNISYSADVSS